MRVAKGSNFQSRDNWPIWLWLFLLFLAGSLAVAIQAALGNQWSLITFLGEILLLLWAAIATPLEISFDGEDLRIGKATISTEFIQSVTPLTTQEMALLRGRDADPRCWMALRFWVPSGVKIVVKDPQDPTPYWLVSIKKATALAAAIKHQTI